MWRMKNLLECVWKVQNYRQLWKKRRCMEERSSIFFWNVALSNSAAYCGCTSIEGSPPGMTKSTHSTFSFLPSFLCSRNGKRVEIWSKLHGWILEKKNMLRNGWMQIWMCGHNLKMKQGCGPTILVKTNYLITTFDIFFFENTTFDTYYGLIALKSFDFHKFDIYLII